jgi:hypothetical protein
MNDEPLSLEQQPAEDDIGLAFKALQDAIRSNDAEEVTAWRQKALGDIGNIHYMVQEYRDAMARDARKMEAGDVLYKDDPPLNRFKKTPKRKAGFVDAAHSAEQQVGHRMNALLTHIEKSPDAGSEAHSQVLQSFRALAEVLDDHGLYLDQGRTYAPKKTMPAPDGEDLVTSRVHKSGGLFDRLKNHDSGDKQR